MPRIWSYIVVMMFLFVMIGSVALASSDGRNIENPAFREYSLGAVMCCISDGVAADPAFSDASAMGVAFCGIKYIMPEIDSTVLDPSYMQGKESFRRCFCDLFRTLGGDICRPFTSGDGDEPPEEVEPPEEEPTECSITIDKIVPACDEPDTTEPVVFHGSAVEARHISHIVYSVIGDKGYSDSGECISSECDAVIPAEEFDLGEKINVTMTAYTSRADVSCTGEKTLKIGDPRVGDFHFGIDPLVYEVKGMSKDLNPYDDHIVSTYDDMVLSANIYGGIRASTARKVRVKYSVVGGGYEDSGIITVDDLERTNFMTGTSDPDDYADLTSEIRRIAPDGLDRDRPHMIYDSCEIKLLIPLANRWTHRGDSFEGSIIVEVQNEEGVWQEIDRKNDFNTVAQYNFLFLNESGYSGYPSALVEASRRQFNEFYRLAQATGGPLQNPSQAKLIFRTAVGCSVPYEGLDNLTACFRDLEECWTPDDTLAAVAAPEVGFARYYGNLLTFGDDSKWVFAHEMGHTYGICDEYSYATYNAMHSPACSNSYPECATDHPNITSITDPEEKRLALEEANGCYNKRHAALSGMSDGSTIYTDTAFPSSFGYGFCMGDVLGCDITMRDMVWSCGETNARRSIMGAATSTSLVNNGMVGGHIEPGYPDGAVLPVPRRR